MAFAAAASVLSDRETYQNFYRTLPSFDLNAATMAQLMRQFGWQQMSIITQEESVFTEVGNQFFLSVYCQSVDQFSGYSDNYDATFVIIAATF